MTIQEGRGAKSDSLGDLLDSVPDDKLDTPDVEGGLTWRQATILGLTSGYLRQYGDDKLTLDDSQGRQRVRLVVDATIREDKSCWGSAKDILVKGLEVACEEYERLASEDVVWSSDRGSVQDLLETWSRDDLPYITEEFAGNVLWYMYYYDGSAV